MTIRPMFHAVDIREGVRVVSVTVEFTRYEIPEPWLMGMCRTGLAIEDALRHWHEQAQLQAAFEAEQAA